MVSFVQVKQLVTKAHAAGTYRRLKGLERVAVHARPTPLKAGTTLVIGKNKYPIEEDCFLVFVDLMHDANFAHPVVYELHSVATGKVRTIEEQFPIADVEIQRSLTPLILPGKEAR